MNQNNQSLISKIFSALNHASSSRIENFTVTDEQLGPLAPILISGGFTMSEIKASLAYLQYNADVLSKSERKLRMRILSYMKIVLVEYLKNREVQFQMAMIVGNNSGDLQTLALRIIDMHIEECERVERSKTGLSEGQIIGIASGAAAAVAIVSVLYWYRGKLRAPLSGRR